MSQKTPVTLLSSRFGRLFLAIFLSLVSWQAKKLLEVVGCVVGGCVDFPGEIKTNV